MNPHHLSIHLSIYYLSLCLSIYLFICPVYLYFCLSIDIHISIHPFTLCLSINTSVHPAIHPSIYLFMYLSIHLSIFKSIRPFIPISIFYHITCILYKWQHKHMSNVLLGCIIHIKNTSIFL